MRNERAPLSDEDKDRIIGMAWEDRTPFDAITMQFGLTEQHVRNLMKATLKPSSYRTWRKRVEAKCSLKHAKVRAFAVGRYHSQKQKLFR